MGLFDSTKDSSKISKISNPTINDIAKINSNGEIENSNIQADDVVTKITGGTNNNIVTRDGSGDIQDGGIQISNIEQNINKVSAFQQTPDNTKYPSEKLVKDNLDLKADINNLKANSAVYVNSLTGDDNNNGLSLANPFETVGKGLTDVTNSGNVIILGSDTQSINHTFTSSQNSIKVSISDAFKISGTLNLVDGNTSMEFYNGKTNATITDDSAGTFYMNNVNVGGATINFSRSGYKVIRGSTSVPTLINLTGSGGTLYLENISGGVININIGSGWTVYTVNSLLHQITNNGIVSDANSTIVSSLIENQVELAALVSSGAVGLFALNFANPSITGLSGLTKGDIIYKVGTLHFRSYSFLFAPATISIVKTATEQNSYHKEGDEWVLTKNKLNPVLNGTANHLVSQDAGGKLEPTTINKNDVALKDSNAVASQCLYI